MPLRIRKLLFCLCYRHWEQDAEALNQLNLADLIQQSLQIAPQRKDLKYQLGRIVKRINRRKTYTRVANDVMAAFQVLYSQQYHSGGGAIGWRKSAFRWARKPCRNAVGGNPSLISSHDGR